ncbi:MAG: bifunctional 5,10-methylenetetrahydrofolate dehydrogenase/5,10-methenyltetrahydrofolate cyclohydrolase [Chlamydiales bacterium]|nr:bifunctional 5,10-methylenetetrahydrofolate dehydrogenase/5,10-methenyltetrahydrofolate cyclohydrolase [Chlamydiales bacterium]
MYLELQSKIDSSMTKPGLAFILVGEDPGSIAYVNMKQRKCKELGFYSKVVKLSEDVASHDLLKIIQTCNDSPQIHGILVQQPLPSHLDTSLILSSVLPEKDVDGFHPVNVGKMVLEDASGFIACTPLGIVKMLAYYNISLEGKHVVIVGRSNIVGRPLSILLSQKRPFLNATVTLCHSGTTNLAHITNEADVLITAIGKPKFIKMNMVKDNAVVIDVGINRLLDDHNISHLVGDVDFGNVAQKCSYITPVPGGVGPMTIAMLMYNTYISYTKSI